MESIWDLYKERNDLFGELVKVSLSLVNGAFGAIGAKWSIHQTLWHFYRRIYYTAITFYITYNGKAIMEDSVL